MTEVLSVGAGVGILLLVLTDTFLTVFHAQGRGGPVTHFQNRAVWALFRAATRSPAVLGFAAPLMVVLTITTWTVLFVAGYALIYLPWIDTFLVSPGSLRAGVVEALYYSGYTGATLGLGDLTADLPILRLITILQAFNGFALVSAAISYLLATYRELIAKRTLSLHIAGYFRANDVSALVTEPDAPQAAVARWSESVTHGILHTIQAHFQYPILHYFRPDREAWALPLQLDRVLHLRAEAERGTGGAIERHPSFRSLFDAVEDYAAEVDRHFVPASFAGSRADAPERLQRIQRYMAFD